MNLNNFTYLSDKTHLNTTTLFDSSVDVLSRYMTHYQA